MLDIVLGVAQCMSVRCLSLVQIGSAEALSCLGAKFTACMLQACMGLACTAGEGKPAACVWQNRMYVAEMHVCGRNACMWQKCMSQSCTCI